jgi:phosphohistidine phosphatase
MKTLLLFRHAKAEPAEEAADDHSRPLAKRGRKDAPRMGELVRKMDAVPEQIISSTARRTQETSETFAGACGYRGPITYTRDIYEAPPEAYVQALARHGGAAARVMIVGHNPALEQLLELLTGEDEDLPTGAIAQISLPIEDWGELTPQTPGRLVNLWRPKELDD